MNKIDLSTAKLIYKEPMTDIICIQTDDIITTSPSDENWGEEWDGRE